MKKFIKALAIILCLSLITPSFISNSGIETVQAATKSKIKLNYTKKTIYEGDTFKLKISGTTKKVTWSSSNKKIAIVTSKGVVKGVSAGICKITAKVSGKKYTCKVTVKKSQTSNKEERKIEVDTTSYICDRYDPENKVQIIDYSISNDKIYITYKMIQVGKPGRINFGAYIYEYDKNGNIVDDIYVYSSNLTVGYTFTDYAYLDDETVRIGVNQSSSNNSESDNSSEDIGASKDSVSENIVALKQYIKTYGKTNTSGDKYISYSLDGYTSGVVYDMQTGELMFLMASSNCGLTMSMISANNSSYMQVEYTYLSEGIGFIATGSLNPTSYSSTSKISFTMTEKTTDLLTNSDIQDLCNAALRVGFTGWQVVLCENLQMTLQDIGFTSYN